MTEKAGNLAGSWKVGKDSIMDVMLYSRVLLNKRARELVYFLDRDHLRELRCLFDDTTLKQGLRLSFSLPTREYGAISLDSVNHLRLGNLGFRFVY
jgi:hypothetical protein